ncbi:hypothetical protein SAMN05216569_3228 [Pseudoxanthomonas sp. CF125]|nr:hypothetical protein SAMN05216569_3228 [Pseudoxanthomonas sp. CF125]
MDPQWTTGEGKRCGAVGQVEEERSAAPGRADFSAVPADAPANPSVDMAGKGSQLPPGQAITSPAALVQVPVWVTAPLDIDVEPS